MASAADHQASSGAGFDSLRAKVTLLTDNPKSDRIVITPPSASERVRVRRPPGSRAVSTFAHLTRDVWLLYLTRFVRLFAYGSLSVVLVFYLVGLGLSEVQTGMLLTLTLAGDTVISLFLTTRADRIGRRRMLVAGALLMTAAGITFAGTSNLLLLLLAGIVGVISPSGNEVGPFLPIEQAALTHVVPAAVGPTSSRGTRSPARSARQAAHSLVVS